MRTPQHSPHCASMEFNRSLSDFERCKDKTNTGLTQEHDFHRKLHTELWRVSDPFPRMRLMHDCGEEPDFCRNSAPHCCVAEQRCKASSLNVRERHSVTALFGHKSDWRHHLRFNMLEEPLRQVESKHHTIQVQVIFGSNVRGGCCDFERTILQTNLRNMLAEGFRPLTSRCLACQELDCKPLHTESKTSKPPELQTVYLKPITPKPEPETIAESRPSHPCNRLRAA